MKKYSTALLSLFAFVLCFGASRAMANWRWAKACDAQSAATGELICSIPAPGSN